MLKTVLTLMRGAAAAAEEEVVDRSALLILDQQIREAASATDRAKRALALAIAQDEAEAKRLETIIARIADLETRALAALAGGREDLVAEAAEAIATLEADRDAIREARAHFLREIGQMKSTVAGASRRLADSSAVAGLLRPPKLSADCAPAAPPTHPKPRRSSRPNSRCGACARGRPRKRQRRRLCRGSKTPAPPTFPIVWRPPASGHARGRLQQMC